MLQSTSVVIVTPIIRGAAVFAGAVTGRWVVGGGATGGLAGTCAELAPTVMSNAADITNDRIMFVSAANAIESETGQGVRKLHPWIARTSAIV
jgi:hypothetical protein